MPDEREPSPGKIDIDEIPESERLLRFDETVVPFVPPRAAETPRLAAPGPRILSLGDFTAKLAPQDFLIHGIVERGWLYAMTGTTGSGKTAIAAMMSLTMAHDRLPKTIGPHDVEPGRVIYCAGENPTDTARRFQGLGLKHDADLGEARVGIVEGAFSIEQHYNAVKEQITTSGNADLIVVDTAQAFAYLNGVREENANMEMVKFATMLRSLTKMPGSPAVLVLCHPTKNAAQDVESMIPRGGGGFVNEIDANIVLLTQDRGTVTMQPHPGKFRGMPFDPMIFHLATFTHPSFNDTRGRPGYTVIAELLAEQAADERAEKRAESDRAVLSAIYFRKRGMRQAELIEVTGLPRSTISDALRRLTLRGVNLVKKGATDTSLYELTPGGVNEAKRL